MSSAGANPPALRIRASWSRVLRSKSSNEVTKSSMRPALCCSRAGSPGLQGLFLLVRQFRTKERNHHVPTSQNAALCPDFKQIFSARVSYFHFLRISGIAEVSGGHNGAVESKPNRRIRHL